jgi:hypothetical protein
VPYAIYAPNAGAAATAATAGTAGGVAPGAVTGAGIASGTITAGNIAGGQVVKNINGLADNVTLAGTNGIVLNVTGNTLTISNTPADYGIFYYTFTGTSYAVGPSTRLPITSYTGWTLSSGSLPIAPAAGLYLVQYGGYTSTGGIQIGAAINGSSIVAGSDTFTTANSSFSHSFIVYLTANETLAIYNLAPTATLYLTAPITGSAYSETVFSMMITRIN